MTATDPPGPVLGYARRLSALVAGASEGRLIAAYLHGSAVLGGWTAARSDVDLLLVTGGDPPGPVLDAVAGVIVSAAAECPGAGLECSMVTAAQAAAARPPWPFLTGSRIISKIAGGQAALDRGLADAAVLNRALDQQLGNVPPQAIGPAAAAFVRSAVASLRAAAAQPGY